MSCKDCKGITLLKGTGIESITNNGDGTFTILLTNGETHITDDFTGPQGIQGPQGDPGTNGTNGTNGVDGVGIQSIAWTSNSGGQPQGTQGTTDTYTITMTDATTYVFLVTNGADGAPGTPGTSITWITRTNVDAQFYTFPTGNMGMVNEYDQAAPALYTLPNSGLSIGDTIEIIDNKGAVLVTGARIGIPVGFSVVWSSAYLAAATSTIVFNPNYNTTIKLTYIGNNTWAVTNYECYDSSFITTNNYPPDSWT